MAVRVALFFLALLASVDGGLLSLPICVPLCPVGKVCLGGPPLLGLITLTGTCDVCPSPLASVLGLVTGLINATATVVTYNPKTPCVTDLAVGTLLSFDAATCGPSVNLGTALNLKADVSASVNAVASSVINVAGALNLATNVVRISVGKGVCFLGAASKLIVQTLNIDAGASLLARVNATASAAAGGVLSVNALVLAGATSSLTVDGIVLSLGTGLLNGGSLVLGSGAGLALQVSGQIKAGVDAGLTGALVVKDKVSVLAGAVLDLAVGVVLGVGASVDAAINVAAGGLLTLSAGLVAAVKADVAGTLTLAATGINFTAGLVLRASSTLVIDIRNNVITPTFANIDADATATVKILVPSVAAVKVAGLASVKVLVHAITDIASWNPRIILADITGDTLVLTRILVADTTTLNQALLGATSLTIAVLLPVATPVVDLTLGQIGVLAGLGVAVNATTAVTTVVTAGPVAVALGAVAKLGAGLSGVVKLPTVTLGNAAVAVAAGTSATLAVGAGITAQIGNLIAAAGSNVLLLNTGVGLVAGVGATLNATLNAGAGLSIAVDRALADLNATATAVGVDLQSIVWADHTVLQLGAGIAAHLGTQVVTAVGAELRLADKVIVRGATTLGGTLVAVLDGTVGRVPAVVVDAGAALNLGVNVVARAVANAQLSVSAAVAAGAAIVVKDSARLALGVAAGASAVAGVTVAAVVKVETGATVAINGAAAIVGGIALNAGATLHLAVGNLLSKTESEGGCGCAPNLGAALTVAANAVIEIAVTEFPKPGVYNILAHSCPVEIAAGFVGQIRLVKVNAAGEVLATVNLAVKNALTVDGTAYASASARRLLQQSANCSDSFTWTQNGAELTKCDDGSNSASRVPLAYLVYALLAAILMAFY